MRTQTSLLPKVLFTTAFALALLVGFARSTHAQGGGEVVPANYQSGSFFNQKLGTALRFNYRTRGYGTQDDVFSVGGMKVFNMDEGTVYVDGQGTMSNDFGGGFNLGVGYRLLTNSSNPIMQFDPERVLGLGFWTDGQSTASDNFFTQLGFSFESLGESFDTRLNGYFPLERNQSSDPVLVSTGAPFFVGNNLFGASESFIVDTALTVIDSEFAKRINDLEAWAFVGTYHLGGGGIDTTGYRAGVRGYAVPDLALSLQVTDDNVYATNVMFGITWFIGRTNRENGPCGTIADRLREPVLRNNIATTSRRVSGDTGEALTAQGTTDAIDIVHVNSNASAGGDGTFENPLNTLALADDAGNSRDGSIILVHATSAFTGTDGQLTLQNNQRVLGEGLDAGGNQIDHIVSTSELGDIVLPETVTGAKGLARPTINGAGVGDLFTIGATAGDTSINNFTINNASTAVRATGADAPALRNLSIINATGDAVVFANVTGTGLIENTVTIENAAGRALFVSGGDSGLALAPTITNSAGRSLEIVSRSGGTLTFSGTITDTGQGVNFENNTGGTIDVTNALDIDVTGNERALTFANNGGATINVNDLDASATNGATVSVSGEGTVTINSADDTRMIRNTGTGNAFVGNGDATLTVGSKIDNSNSGFAVQMSGRTANNATFNDTIDDTGDGLMINGNTGGTTLFTSAITTSTGASNGITIANGNAAALTSFGGGLDITTTSGTGFSATGAGSLAATGTNTLSTSTGKVLEIVGQTIDTAGASFETVNSSGTVAGTAVELRDTTGGLINVGSGAIAGDGGTLTTSGAAAAILVDNADNLAMSNLIIDNGATTGGGLDVINNTTGSRTFAGMDVRTRDQVAIDVNNNSAGTTTFNTLTANTTTGNEDAVVIQNNTGSTVTLNTATIDSTGGVGIRVADNGNANVNLNSFAINTTNGTGLIVAGTGNVNTGGTSTIDSTGGIGIDIDNAEDASVNNVTINAAGANSVLVTHDVGSASDVSLNNLTMSGATGNGVSILSDGTGEFDLSITGANITTSGAGVNGILYELGAAHIGRSDFTLTGSTINAANASAMIATLDNGTGDVRFLIQNNTNLAGNVGAGESAVDISVGSNLTLNATIGNTIVSDPLDPESPPATIGDNNLFTNSGAGAAFRLTESDAGAVVNLDLRDNTAAGGTGFSLSQSLGTFNLVDGVDTLGDLNNIGTVTGVGAITPIAPPVALPTP